MKHKKRCCRSIYLQQRFLDIFLGIKHMVIKEKTWPRPCSCLCSFELHVALHLTGAQAAGANIQGGGGAINDSANTLNVGSPGTLGLADGVADAVAVYSRLSADLTELSHCKNLLMMRKIIQNQNTIILAELRKFGKCFFTDIKDLTVK